MAVSRSPSLSLSRVEKTNQSGGDLFLFLRNQLDLTYDNGGIHGAAFEGGDGGKKAGYGCRQSCRGEYDDEHIKRW